MLTRTRKGGETKGSRSARSRTDAASTASVGEAGRGSREHMRSFDRREDAVRFETEMRRRKQLGELAGFEASKVTLGEFAREWWRRYASTELARSTQERYASMWDLHVLPRLGAPQARPLTPGVVDGFP